MDKKQMYVQVVNLETGKVFSLPTLYTDRVEACVCGQNYVRDRQAEDPCSELFFRVLIVKDGEINPSYNLWDDEFEDEDEDDCDDVCENCEENCFSCGFCEFAGADSEEPNYRELMEGILEVCEEYGVSLVIPRT